MLPITPGAAFIYLVILPPSFAAAQTRTPTQRTPIAQLNLKALLPKYDTRLLGLTPYGTAIIVADKDPLDGASAIVQWSITNKKVVARKPLTKWLDSYDFQMSSNGTTVITNNQRTIRFFPHVQAYRITALRTSDLKITTAVKLRENETTSGYLFEPSSPQHVVMKVQSIIPFPDKSDSYFGHDRFEWLNLQTGKRDKVLRYNSARGCDKIVFSPDKKYLLCLFQDETVDDSDDPRDLSSIIDVLDAKTGKVVWHIVGTNKQPTGEPLFFIAPNRFIAYGTVFNISQRKGRPWSAVNSLRRCLATVPGNSRYALFLTKSGLQLRNWKTERALASWPTITKPGRILWSPDLKTFAFRWGQDVQFWKFDPKWLK